MSLYYLKLTANSSNILLLSLERVCVFIISSEGSISGCLKKFWKFDILPTVAIFVDVSKINKKIFFWKIFQGTRNGTFWLSNEKTNCIWTNLEEIGDNCGWFKLLRTYSNISNYTTRTFFRISSLSIFHCQPLLALKATDGLKGAYLLCTVD